MKTIRHGRVRRGDLSWPADITCSTENVCDAKYAVWVDILLCFWYYYLIFSKEVNIMKPKIVTAAVFIKEQSVLLMRRAPGENLAGKWEFPGGKLESGETPELCLQREINEELGILGAVGAHVCDSLFEYPSGSILLKAYFVDWQSGDIQLRVHDKMHWVHRTELLQFDLAPADVEIAKRVQEVMDNV